MVKPAAGVGRLSAPRLKCCRISGVIRDEVSSVRYQTVLTSAAGRPDLGGEEPSRYLQWLPRWSNK